MSLIQKLKIHETKVIEFKRNKQYIITGRDFTPLFQYFIEKNRKVSKDLTRIMLSINLT